MVMKVPTAGADALLKDALGKTTPAALTLKLFVNNYTPVDASVAGSFTEMSTLGYAAKTLAMASWTESNVAGVATAAYAAQTWTFTAGTAVTVYGYYVVGADTVIRFAEKFDTPFIAQFAGDAIVITPQLTNVSAA